MTDSLWYKLAMHGLEFFGLYYSSYRGFVLDNNDPEGLGRIKVSVPSINPNDKLGSWAFPKNIWGGKDYGVQVLPLINDMVWVEYEHGNSLIPIWSHAGYALDERPSEFDKTTNYGFKTPKKNIIIIEDGITDADGKILVKFKTNKEYFLIEQDKFELESSLIKLGKNGDEWAVLGETLKSKLESIIEKIEINQNILSTHTHTTNAGPSGPPIQSSAIVNIKAGLTSIKNSLSQILSGKVKIDK